MPATYARPVGEEHLLHGTIMSSASGIIREVPRVSVGRRDSQFADAAFNARQVQYSRDSSDRKGCRRLIETEIARAAGGRF